MGLIKIDNNQQYLAVIVKSLIDQQKQLIFIHCKTLEIIETSNILSKSEKFSTEFLNHIHSLLTREQSIPYVTLSTSTTNISNIVFEENLLENIKILNEEYILKQENVRKELEKKQNYLNDIYQTQLNEKNEFNNKFQNIEKKFQNLIQQYQKEYTRRKHLSSNVNDLLSVIEQSTPVLSDAEIRMNIQLENYQQQINYLKEKFDLLKNYISSNENQEQFDSLSIENIRNLIQNHRDQIDQMKKQLQTIQINK